MYQKIVNLLTVAAILLVILVFSFPYLSKLWTSKAKPTEQTTVQPNTDQPEKPPESSTNINSNSASTTDQTTNPENNPTPPTQSDTTPKSPTPPQENPDINQNRGKYEEMKDAYSRDII